jgi:polar amino acid transport system substrate-binding protein
LESVSVLLTRHRPTGEVLADPDINLIVIGTRHDLHAETCNPGASSTTRTSSSKNLSLSTTTNSIACEAAANSKGRLMVGFNRRFSPLAQRAKEFFAGVNSPLSMLYRVNAGRIPKEHWTQDAQEGGGRIVGEAVHFIDLMQFLTGSPPSRFLPNA